MVVTVWNTDCAYSLGVRDEIQQPCFLQFALQKTFPSKQASTGIEADLVTLKGHEGASNM